MVKNISRVVYKPDHEKTDEFIVIINPPEYKKWKEGDLYRWQKFLILSRSFIPTKDLKESWADLRNNNWLITLAPTMTPKFSLRSFRKEGSILLMGFAEAPVRRTWREGAPPLTLKGEAMYQEASKVEDEHERCTIMRWESERSGYTMIKLDDQPEVSANQVV